MAESYEPLNPRNPFETPASARTDVPATGYDAMLGNLTDEGEQDRRIITDILGADIPSSSVLPMPQKAAEGSPFRPDALEYRGVNWATPSAEGTTKTFQNDPGFYNVDYDPDGKIGKTLGKTENEVLAANVFGRQFSRAELEKDSEGRKIIELMESRRSGETRSAGFLSGFADWNLGNIPFVGWLMDVGTTVGDAVSMSQTMKKMQNGEAVTDHEALAVRRFMLQQEIDSERSTGYEVGAVIRGSLPFMAEIAASSALIAGSAKAGAAIGTFIGGPVGTAIGAIVGGAGALLFGGGGRILSKVLGRGGAKVATNALGEFAERSAKQGFARGERAAILDAASKFSGLAKRDLARTAVAEGRANALEAMGREMLEKEGRDVASATPEMLREYALGHATKAEIAKRQGFESAKYLANSYRKAYDGAMDANLARFLLVDGDTSNVFHYGLNTAFEDRLLSLAGATRGTKGFRGIIREQAAKLAGEGKLKSVMDEVTESFVSSAASGAFGKRTGAEAVNASILRSLGGAAAENRTFTAEVMKVMAARAQKSFEMKYARSGFVNGMERFAGFLGEGALDGALRWESSMFGGIGTLARDGTVLGGKMNALKEALRASFVEAPVRGALQLGSQAMTWPVVSAATGNGFDFAVRGQLSAQAQALQTGDRDLMDHARAVALGAGLVEYISENAGRGLSTLASGVLKPFATDRLIPEAVQELGSHMAKKIDLIFGGEALMKEGVRKRVVDSIANRVGRLAVKGKEGAASVTRDEIDRFVTSKSFEEAPNLMRVLGKDAKTALTDALREGADLTKREAAILYFTAFKMMDRGFTPQAMANFLERVGYDGILSEMAEERYGGFFQGLFGLNERPSDEGFEGRWKAAMEGLFPDRHQLVVEALGFAFPSVMQLSMNHLYSRLGQGPMSELRNDMRVANTAMSDEVRLTMPVESPEYARKVEEYQAGERELYTKALGGSREDLVKRVTANSRAVLSAATGDAMEETGDVEIDEAEHEAGRTDARATISMVSGAKFDDAGHQVPGEFNKREKALDPDDEFDSETIDEDLNRIIDAPDEETYNARLSQMPFGALALQYISRERARRHPDLHKVDSAPRTPITFNENNQEFTSVENEEQAARLLEEKADRIVELSAGSEEKLNQNLAKYEAEKLFGADGVEAIRWMWRQDQRNTDAKKREALEDKEGEYYRFVSNPPAPEYRGPANVDAVVNEITASLPFRSDDASAIAESRARFSTATGVEVNQFRNDMASVVAGAFERIGNAYSRVELGLSKNLSWGRKALMRFTGIMNAVTTGDLSLAARNPVQWAMEESGIPKGLGSFLAAKKRDSVMAGMRTVLNEMVGTGEMTQEQAEALRKTDLSKVDGGLIERFEKAGERQYRETLYDFAHLYLAARNVLSVTNGDIEDAALRVVADRKGARDFRTDAFRRDNAEEIVSVKRQIVGALAKMTATRAVSIDTHGKFGNLNTTVSVFDYERAMRYGTSAEIVAAIRTMPAFRGMDAVADVSDGGAMNPEAFGRVVDVDALAAIPTDRDLTPEELSAVIRASGRDYGPRSESDNQRFAKVYVERLRIRRDTAEPSSFVDAEGRELKGVTVSYSRDPDTNARVATVSYNGQTASAPTAREAALLAGIVPVMPKLAIVHNDQLMSRDATSLALVLFGSRDAAREAFEAAYPKAKDEMQFPPALRRDSDGSYRHSDEEAARVLADELGAARSGNPVAGDQVNGTGKPEDQYERGYESVMAGILESRFGVRRDHMSASARTAAGGEAVYSARFNNFRIGDTTFVQSDYFTEGDAEASVRCALANSLYLACTKDGYVGMSASEALDVCRRADRDFVSAAKDLIAEYRERNPDKAARIREALASISKDGAIDSFSVSRIGAIAAASVVFSDERGMTTRGNGFLHGPELALIADRFRATSKWAPFLASLADEALGGNGFFTETAVSRGGFSRVLNAFAPSGMEVASARANAVFTDSDGSADKGPVKYVTYKVEPTVLTEGGEAVGVSFSVSGDNAWQFSADEGHSVQGLTASVAASCHEVARAFRAATNRAMTSADAYRVLRSLEERDTESRGSIGVYSDVGDRKPSAQRSAAVMADEVAVGIGQNLRFLSDDFAAPVGGIGGRVAAERALPRISDFLFRNGLNQSNIDRVAGQLQNAFGAQATELGGDAADTLSVSRADDEDEANAYMDALADGEGNGDIFNHVKRMNAVIDNRDLMALGRQFQWTFPSEGANFTQVLVRTRSELRRLESLKGTTPAVKRVSRYFSLLARPRTGTAVDAISYGTAVWNDAKVTDAVLRDAVRDLAEAGQYRIAFVLNGIRAIPAEGKRRTTALALMGTLTAVDANRIEMGADEGLAGPLSIRVQGSAGDVPVSSVRASVAHLLSKDVLGNYVSSSIMNMSNALTVGARVPTNGKIGGREWNAADIEAMLAPGKDDAKLAAAVQALVDQLEPTPESHETVVAFARAFRDRMLRAADVCDYLFGADNEFAFALRNPETVAYVVRDIERLMDTKVKKATRKYVIGQYVQDFSRAGVEGGYRCRLVYDALVSPLKALANQAMNDRGDRPTESFTSSTRLSVEELRAALGQKSFMDALLHSDLNASRDRTKWFPSAKDVKNRRVNSTLKRFLDRYVASAPRSVVRLNGQRSEDLEDTRRVTGVTASPAPMEQRCIDRMLSELAYGTDSNWKKRYLSNGGRWDDGTRMIVATAGAKVGEELAEGRFLSPIVALANFSRFLANDTRNVLFETYHGEKPTVYSFNVPGTVCQQILDDIHAGKEYTKNPVTEEILGDVEKPLPKDVNSKTGREELYAALYSVVAANAGCDEMDTKRTQLLLSMGTPFAAHRDTRTVMRDGVLTEEKASSVTNAKGEPVVPGLFKDIMISGGTGASDLGMYLNTGLLVEAQRALSTNPDAVSFKNHLVDWLGSGLTKGQSHDFGLEMHPEDRKTNSGNIRAARARQRRRIEKVLGLKDGILDLPPADKVQTREETAEREAAVASADAFLTYSTVMATDRETEKSGPFSKRCGFAASGPVEMEIVGKRLRVTRDGNRMTVETLDADGNAAETATVSVDTDADAGQALPFFDVLPGVMKALGLKELTEEDIGGRDGKGGIVSEFVRANGTTFRGRLADAGIFRNLNGDSGKGDRLSVEDTGDGFVFHAFTRAYAGQIVANSDASSEPSLEHPAATNWDRDLVANEGRLLADGLLGRPEASVAISISRVLPYLVLKGQPNVLADRIRRTDPELYANWMAHPNSDDVKTQLSRKLNSLYAKSMRAYVNSTHAVLMGSGLQATDVDPDTGKVTYAKSSGVTDYDADCFRECHVLTQAEKDAFGVGRALGSGNVNISDPSFRYGWHLDMAAFSASGPAVDKAIERRRATYEENLGRLRSAYGDATPEMEAVAKLATLITAASEARRAEDRKAFTDVLGGLFTDYTGRHLSENAACDLSKVSFGDLFLRDGRFDLSAFDFLPQWQRTVSQENMTKGVYLGGSVFAGDRRPSGNYEAATGLFRAQDPVDFDADGTVGPSALYQLPPLVNKTQGSDTDGDSATGTVFWGSGPSVADKRFLDRCRQVLPGLVDKALQSGFADAAPLFADLRDEFPGYFETDRDGLIVPSERFNRAIANRLLQCELDIFRLMPNEEQGRHVNGYIRDVNETIGARRPDYGLVGRKPVGTDAVSAEKKILLSGRAADTYRRITGKTPDAELSYDKAFKECVNKITGKPSVDMLRWKVAAGLSGSAADANEARGVGVSVQATLEHLFGYSSTDTQIAELCPGLFRRRTGYDGRATYRPAEDFDSHQDGISNALFDVVKDLFAPRAGWRKDLMNYLTAKLVRDANGEYLAWEKAQKDNGAAGEEPHFDDEWFFVKLVEFAQDLNRSEESVPWILDRLSAFDNFGPADRLTGQKTFLGKFEEVRQSKELVFADFTVGYAVDRRGRPVVRDGSKGRFLPTMARKKTVRDGAGFAGAKSIGYVKSLIRSMADALRADYADPSTLDDTVPEGENPETYVTERAAYEEALSLGWRPTYMMLAGKWDVPLDKAKDICSRCADVLDGVVRDGNGNARKVETRNRDELTAVACSLLFEADAEGALPYAEEALKAIDLFSRIRRAEAGFSPDTALRAGGTKASRAAAKNAEYVAEFGPQMSDEARFAYGAAQLRLNDETAGQYNAVADAKRMSADARALSEMELNGGDDADFAKWADGANVRPPETKTDAEAFMHASALAGDVTAGAAEENLANMRHLVGAVKLGMDELGKDAFVELVESKYLRTADLVAGITDSYTVRVTEKDPATGKDITVEKVIPGSIVAGDYRTETGVSIGADAVSLLNRLRSVSGENGGRVDLVGRFRQEDVESMRNGFRQLKAITEPVIEDSDGRKITGRELAALIRLNVAASFRFDPVVESALRTNVSEMFGTEVDEMERWGSLVTHDLALRQLCLVPRATVANRAAYGLLHARGEDAEPAVSREFLRKATGALVPKFGKGAAKMANPLRIMAEMLSDGDSALVRAFETAETPDPSFLPVAEQPRPVVSDFAGTKPWHLRPATKVEGVRFVGANGERFDTVEEAANSRIDARIAELKAQKSADGAAWLAKARMALRQMDAPRTSAVFSGDGSEFPITQNRNTWSVENAVDDTIAETAGADAAFDETLRNAALEGGRFGGTSNRLVRRRMESFIGNRLALGRPRPSLAAPSVAPGATIAARMRRGEFFSYLEGLGPENADRFVANPYENVRHALEKAFGKWSSKTGVRVERVVRNGLPLDLLKVTRKVRDAKGTHHVTTYMSFGDVIPLDVKNRAYNEGVLEIVNSRRRANGLAELPYAEFAELSDAERIALANAAGAVVKGDSAPVRGVLGTDALLAVTGLVRLSERSDYRTLFHEYFHQMLDFYRRAGICTAKDEAELLKRFSPDGKTLNEEAAADAFAAYVTGMTEREAAGKLLADGASGDDRLFRKFRHTAEALLAGTMAYNSRGVPVFMKMMISADFSEREMKALEEAEESRLADLEDELLGKEGTFGFPRNWTEAEGPAAEAREAARLALAAYGRGEAEFSALKGALGDLVKAERENPVQFEARLPGFDTKPAAEAAGSRDPMTKYLTDASVPANVRVRRILSEALKRVEDGVAAPESREELDAFRKIANNGLNEVAATDLEKTVSVARRAVLQTCDALGIVARNADGTPNGLGEVLFSDEEVSKFALRLVHAFSTVRARENDYTLDESVVRNGGAEAPSQYASADFVTGRILATVVPQQWGVYARRQAAEAARLFRRAADRASATARATGERKYENYATMAAARAADVERFADAVARGEDLHGLLPRLLGAPSVPRGRGQDAANLFGWAFRYITNSARPVQHSDGTTRYEAAEGSVANLDYGDQDVQNAIYAAARAFGVANVVRKWAKENGVELPAAGEPVTLPADPVEPPAEGTLEPDTSPQVILQTQSSWLASDLSRRIFGHDLRDTLTDVSLQAAAEETNRICNRIDFLIGANVLGEGDRANEIEEIRSDLVVENGMPLAGTGRGRLATRVAGTRGYVLGIFNRSARTVGDAYTKGMINFTHWVGQAIGAMANGDPLYTGYDVPWASRKSLEEFLARLDGRTTAAAAGDVFSAEQLANRVSGKARAAGRTDNIDLFLSRVVQGVPPEILGKTERGYDPNGLYCQVLDQIAHVAKTRTDGTTMTDADFHDRLVRLLADRGLCSTCRKRGRSVLVVPTSLVERAWNASSVKRNLVENCGRKEGMLSLRYLADLLASEANRLNGVAAKSKFLSGEFGSALSGSATPGIWFEGGTGHHQLFVDRFVNAREAFRGEPSPEDQLKARFEAFQETLEPHSKEVGGVVRGTMPAFAQDGDGRFVNVSDRQLGYLARLLGLGRVTDAREFGQAILNGKYRSSNPENATGFDIDPKMSLFEFDRLVFEAQAANLVMEANGEESFMRGVDGKAPTRQELVDAYEFNRRLQAKIMADGDQSATGRICSMSEKAMFERFGRLGSAKTGTERLRSMAESIVHAERFRGCLAQMLCSVGTDGSLNYVVSPSDAATGMAPDAYWMALARFTADRLGDRIEFRYNEGLSGVENMRAVAAAAKRAIGKGQNPRMRYHMLPPDEIGAEYVFGEIWCLDDLGGEDILNRTTNRGLRGSAAAGYMRQLFAITESPSVWNGFRRLDRLMSYSKAASVGLSGFFAFATRFESPVAACGFWNTAMGYTKATSKLARRLAGTKLGRMAGFRENLPYLADFVESVTSDDPAIQYMRELCDMIGMPLTDSVMNPLTGKMGGIDADIARISKWLENEGHGRVAREVRTFMKAALHNPSEYAFSNILNCVKMAVVAQTLYRLREECEAGNRPFDPIRELRKHSAYINAEIGGIQPEQYAWLTPGMQQLLRLAMFSYQWTLGAWVAGSGGIVTDLLFGGHTTTAESRKFAFVRWMRMLGIVKVGVPVFMQAVIRLLATAMTKAGWVGDPDDKDPLGIEDMPWLCFRNESKIGPLAFDITPVLRLAERIPGVHDIRARKGYWPAVTTAAGTVAGFALGGKTVWGTLLGAGAGAMVPSLLPGWEGVGRGANTTGRRRSYMHFAKQSDEFWRWFTDAQGQLAGKLSIPLQKALEALGISGSQFDRKYEDMSMADRFINLSVDPGENAIVNLLTGFSPFSFASIAGHADAGAIGMIGPVNYGISKTAAQKQIVARLKEFALDDSKVDVWSSRQNKKQLTLLVKDILHEAKMNGINEKQLLTSALGEVTMGLYRDLYSALPKTTEDSIDAKKAGKVLRALNRLNRKRNAMMQSLKAKYADAGVDWRAQNSAATRAYVREFLADVRTNPFISQRAADEITEKYMDRYFGQGAEPVLRSTDVRQDSKGGEDFSNFLATDRVPDTIFGIPVVSRRGDYTEEDIAFFRANPRAGGYYDMGDEETEPGSQGAVGGGRGKRVVGYPESEYEYTREKNPTRIDPNDIKGTGVSFTDADRVRVPEERLGEYGKWLDRIAALDPTMKEQRLVPPDWRTNPEWKEFQRDYDYGAAFMAGVEVPTEKASDGRYHLSDAGKLPTHPTFSKESYYARDPRWSGLAGEWTKEGNYVPGELESRRRLLRAPSDDLRDLWNRAVKSTGNLDGMARTFAAMAGESSLSQRGATAEQISNGHLARLIVHANETDRYNKNPANYRKRTVLDTTNSASHVLSKYKWGTGPGANWFDSSKMEPRFDLINSDPVAAKTARILIMNVARFLNGDLKGKDWLPSDAISYGDGPKGLMPDREEIKPEENRIGPMPRGFRIGRKKGAK